MSLVGQSERAIHEDLARSIGATLHAEARRNELAIAWVRTVALLGLSVMDIWYTLTVPSVPFAYRVPTWLYALAAVAFLVALRRGINHAAFPFVVPVLDALYILTRAQMTFLAHPMENLERSHELATVALGSAILIATGGFRLSAPSLIVTSGAGLGLYVWFAAQTRVDAAQVVVHLIVLLGISAAMVLMTRQVRRAVQSEVARVTLSRFLPATLMDRVDSDPIALITRPRSVRATVLVSDIRGFTAWAEHRSPIEVLSALNVVQGRLAAIVRDHHGVVDKFMGDGMLAVFGLPERADHAALAVAAGREMIASVRGLGDFAFRIGVGVHTGDLVIGCLGSGLRMEFTVLGDTVNAASRLEALTKNLEVPLLVSGVTMAACADQSGLSELREVTLRGRDEAITVWGLTELHRDVTGPRPDADAG